VTSAYWQSAMELCRLHCRLASLYQRYTHNRSDERSHLNCALEVLKRSRENDLVNELRGHLTLWRAVSLSLSLSPFSLSLSPFSLSLSTSRPLPIPSSLSTDSNLILVMLGTCSTCS